nr:MAG TPA: hypothetical protein [Bacteriophage sp.]
MVVVKNVSVSPYAIISSNETSAGNGRPTSYGARSTSS